MYCRQDKSANCLPSSMHGGGEIKWRKISMTNKCKCLECGEEFDEDEMHEIHYTEYPGARSWPESVSPCCHAAFDEVD